MENDNQNHKYSLTEHWQLQKSEELMYIYEFQYKFCGTKKF